MRPDDIGLLLLGALGQVSTEQPDPTNAPNTYQHTFSFADAMQYLTAELRYGNTNIAETIASLSITELSFDWALELLTAALTGIGQKPTKGTPTSATFAEQPPFAFHQCTFTFNSAVTGVRAGSVSLGTSVDEDDYTSASRYRQGAEPGPVSGEISFELYFADWTYVELFWGQAGATEPQDTAATYPVNAKFEGATIEDIQKYTLEIDIPKLFLTSVGRPVPGTDKIVQSIAGTIVVDDEATDKPSIILINQETSY